VSSGRLGVKTWRHSGLPGQRQGDSGFGPVGRNGGEAAEARTRAVGVGVRGEVRGGVGQGDGGVRTGPSRPRHRFNGAGARVASAATASGARCGAWHQGERRLRQVGLGAENKDRQVGPRGSDFLN
jgi:hypothetical protein